MEADQRHPASRVRRAVAAWLRLARLVGAQNGALGKRLRSSGISLAQFDLLAQVGPAADAAAGLTQRELARRLVVSEGNITQLLQKMEGQGWVIRQQSGRCNLLALSAQGARLREKLVPGQEAAIAALFSPLSDPELETLSRLLRKIQRGT